MFDKLKGWFGKDANINQKTPVIPVLKSDFFLNIENVIKTTRY